MKVKLTYFKQSGKYYTDGEYDTEMKELYEIWDDIKEMRKNKTLPGVNSGQEFNILVEVPEHPHDHPRFIMVNNL